VTPKSAPAGFELSASGAESAAPDATRAWTATRLQAIAVALSLAVLVAGWFPTAPVRDSATLQDAPEVSLVRPRGYVDIAPLSDVLDAVSLLSERQHIAFVLGLITLWAVCRFARPDGLRQGWRGNARSFTVLMISIAAVYWAAACLPRPMARLASLDPDIVRIDFHSHTQSSKDARRSYTVERNRAWHEAGGYDVAYVTDHETFAGAEQGLAIDPSTWNGSTILLRGIELRWKGEHVGVISGGHEPLVVWNHPRDPKLASLPLASGAVSAIEIANGALHGMDLVRTKREQIVALARQHNLALLSGTDSHGWGYTTPNWTLMHLKGWRHLGRDQLAARIEQTLRTGGFTATHVVERATPDPGTSSTALAFSVLTVPWRMLTELSTDERRMWFVWIAAIVAVEWQLRRRRASRPEMATSLTR